MITRDGIHRTYDTIRPYLRRTPVVDVDLGALTGSGAADAAVSLTLEYMQCSGSFKARGAAAAHRTARTVLRPYRDLPLPGLRPSTCRR